MSFASLISKFNDIFDPTSTALSPKRALAASLTIAKSSSTASARPQSCAPISTLHRPSAVLPSSILQPPTMAPRLNIPPVTRVLLIVLLAQSILSAAIRYREWTEKSEIVIPYLTLIPQLSLVYPWTFLTSSLVEGNVFTLTIGCLTLFNGGRYLERAWSSADLAKFVALVSLASNVLTFGVMVFFFTLTRNERWTYVTRIKLAHETPRMLTHVSSLSTIAGTIPIQISFLVAFSQLIPAHTVTLFRGILSLRVPRFPIVYIGIVFVLSLTPLLSRAALWLAIFGFLTSWTYLRFYKTVFPDLDSSQPTSLRGDASETFAFAEFFPGPVKPAVAAVSNQIFDLLVAIKVCTPFNASEFSSGRANSTSQRRGPGGARAEAERRRAIALKALDQRLNAATAKAPPQPSGPTVQSQPTPSTQTAMTSEPGQMLGETSFEPDHDDHDKA